MGTMTPEGSKYEEKADKEIAKEERGGSEMSRVRGASGGVMPSAEQPYPHTAVHDAYKQTNEHGMVSSHDAHRDGAHHHTMGAGEHKGMPHHKNRP